MQVTPELGADFCGCRGEFAWFKRPPNHGVSVEQGHRLYLRPLAGFLGHDIFMVDNLILQVSEYILD